MIIIIIYKGRKHELSINGTDNVKQIMEKFYILVNEGDRFYTKDKVIFKFSDILLNDNEECLNKTADELELMDDDNLTLVRSVDINPGRKNI